MATYTLYAREDSNTANNPSLTVQGNSETLMLTFDSDVGGVGNGDLLLDYIDGVTPDQTTVVYIGDDPTAYEFTVEYFGAFVDSNSLNNVNGYNLNQQEIAIININGQRYFFFTHSAYQGEATMLAFPNGGFQLIGTKQPEAPIAICFAKGTLIRSPLGDVPVEKLEVGDMVTLHAGGSAKIRWVGRRALSCTDLERYPNLRPIKICKNAFGADSPSNDLRVSPQHRMLMEGWRIDLLFGQSQVLAAAKHLVNDHSITVDNTDTGVEYFHLLFDRHEIIFANDCPTESFHPGQWSMSVLETEIREEVFELFPQLRDDISVYGPAACRSLKSFEATTLSTIN